MMLATLKKMVDDIGNMNLPSLARTLFSLLLVTVQRIIIIIIIIIIIMTVMVFIFSLP
jgi:hypothetical protein